MQVRKRSKKHWTYRPLSKKAGTYLEDRRWTGGRAENRLKGGPKRD